MNISDGILSKIEQHKKPGLNLQIRVPIHELEKDPLFMLPGDSGSENLFRISEIRIKQWAEDHDIICDYIAHDGAYSFTVQDRKAKISYDYYEGYEFKTSHSPHLPA